MVIRMFAGIFTAIFWSWMIPPIGAALGFHVVPYWPLISAGATGGCILSGSIITLLALFTRGDDRPRELPLNPVRGVARDTHDPRGQTMHLYFRKRLTDDDLRRTHDLLR